MEKPFMLVMPKRVILPVIGFELFFRVKLSLRVKVVSYMIDKRKLGIQYANTISANWQTVRPLDYTRLF